MKEHNYKQHHPGFKLKGIRPSTDELKKIGLDLYQKGAAFERAIGHFLLDWLNERPTMEVETSGSTGTPKSIVLKKEHMVNSALATGRFFGLKAGNSTLLCLPCEYIAGKMMLVRALVLGLELNYVAPSINPLEQISGSYDFCAMVPLQLKNSLDELKRVKTLLVGGAPIPHALKQKIDRQKTRVFETYGMTETITHIAARRLSGTGAKTDRQLFETLPGITVTQDSRNCLVIHAPKISDVEITTNDLVQLVSESAFNWLGRYDNVINSGGIKLNPEQIESKLSRFITNRFFVMGVPDEDLGEKLVLIVEGELNGDYLLKKMSTAPSLDKFEIPKEVYTIPRFVESDNGKILRQKTARTLL